MHACAGRYNHALTQRRLHSVHRTIQQLHMLYKPLVTRSQNVSTAPAWGGMQASVIICRVGHMASAECRPVTHSETTAGTFQGSFTTDNLADIAWLSRRGVHCLASLTARASLPPESHAYGNMTILRMSQLQRSGDWRHASRHGSTEVASLSRMYYFWYISPTAECRVAGTVEETVEYRHHVHSSLDQNDPCCTHSRRAWNLIRTKAMLNSCKRLPNQRRDMTCTSQQYAQRAIQVDAASTLPNHLRSCRSRRGNCLHEVPASLVG